MSLFKFKISAFQKVILSLVLGVIFGLFIGEWAGNLEIVGKAYVGLLQMTVLPYVMVSVMIGIGRLNMQMAARIGLLGGGLVLFLWLTTMVSNLLLPLGYPNWQDSGFFSASQVAAHPDFDFLKLYIPSNIFYSLSSTIVPAIVLFSLLFGVALVQVEKKDTLLEVLDNIASTLMKMASFVAKTAPYGMFAISASAAGTIDFADLSKLQVFIWCYLVLWFLLAFIALPLFIQFATPFSYRQLFKVSGEAMVTAFATGTVLVVLPMIAERCKELLKENNDLNEDTESVINVMVPTAYSFPSVGTLMGLGFILFSGWYIGTPLSISQYPSYILLGTLSAFGSMNVAIPFMLDFFDLPADHFQLYLLGSVITARFATAMAVLHGFAVSLMVASAIVHKLNWKRLFIALGIYFTIAITAMKLFGFFLTDSIPYEYVKKDKFESMQLMSTPVKTTYLKQLKPLMADELKQDRIELIQKRGVLRVGYYPDTLPFTYINKKSEVVGFDMDLMQKMAADLEVRLEVYRVAKHSLHDALQNGSLDIAVGGIAITPTRATKYTFSMPYTYHYASLVVPDNRRDEFFNLNDINKVEGLKLAYPDSREYHDPLNKLFPEAKLLPIESPRVFFSQKDHEYDALIFTAESSAAWCLLYPEYSVAIPKGLNIRVPVAFGLATDQQKWKNFVDTWINLTKDSDFFEKSYAYWIYGTENHVKTKRWSIWDNVIHTPSIQTEKE